MAQDMVTIRFEGRALDCRADTSVAVALWEHGVRELSRSPKYGRPRGLTCARGQCTACLMRVDGVPNVRTCETPVRAGMDVRRQDGGAFYAGPMQRSLTLGGRLFPVGFYYKWFTRPTALSRFFLKMIRPLTGVGRLPDARPLPAAAAADTAPAPDLGAWRTVVVGAGVAGLRAAAAAAGPVLLLDENPEIGGLRRQALHEVSDRPPGLAGFAGLAAALAGLEEAAAAVADREVTFRGGTRVVAGFARGGLVVRAGRNLATLRGERVVWAAGALDTLGLFPGNDTAGVIGPRALLRLLVRDGLDVTGQRILLVGDGLDLWLAAILAEVRGARVNLVVSGDGMREEIAAAVARKWPLNTGLALAGITRRGDAGPRATFTPLQSTPGPADARLRLDADLIVICGRGKPTYDIPYQLGARLEMAAARGGFVTAAAPAGLDLTAVGEAAGDRPEDLFTPAAEVEA